MTNAEIDALSGRELDAAIGEHLFRGIVVATGVSTLMGVAWYVVETLRARGYRVVIDLGGTGQSGVEIDRIATYEEADEERDYWHCVVDEPIADDSETAVCTAICKAALQAMEPQCSASC